MKSIVVDLKRTGGQVKVDELKNIEKEIIQANEILTNGTGEGNDFIGWLNLPENYDKEEYARIKIAAEKIHNNADVFIVIGIGGSYMGAKAATEMLNHSFYNLQTKEERKGPQVFFFGNNISPKYMTELMEIVKDKEIYVNVISKSGTTVEPAIGFSFFKELLEEKYGKESARERIFVTTDKAKGALYDMSKAEGYEMFVVPDDVGGRYSVLTAVGLLPIAASGIDIDEIMRGARDARNEYSEPSVENNECFKYAAARNILYRKGKTVELFTTYEPSLSFIGEWWKQLYGESEGKDGKGIFPVIGNNTTDLHSVGQYIQEGLRMFFETTVFVEEHEKDMVVKEGNNIPEALEFLGGKKLSYINKQAMTGTTIAHEDGGVPNLTISIKKADAYHFGYLVYFFEKACGVSGYTLGVNPFNQPGVEFYKKNMFALLGRKGYEKQREEIMLKLD